MACRQDNLYTNRSDFQSGFFNIENPMDFLLEMLFVIIHIIYGHNT